MKIEELSKRLDWLDKVLSKLQEKNERSGWILVGEEEAEKTSLKLEARREMLNTIRRIIREPDRRDDSDSLEVFVKPGNRVATIRTPGRFKDQDTSLIVRVSEIPDSEECKIEYLHTEGQEDSEEVLQETFYCQGTFWDLVHHEQDKLKKLNNNPENPLGWSSRL